MPSRPCSVFPDGSGHEPLRQLREPVLRAYEARLHTWMTVNLRPALEKKLDSIAWGTPLTDAPASPGERTPLGDGYGVARLYATLVDPKGHIGGDWATKKLADAWLQLLPFGEAVSLERLSEHARRYLVALEQRPALRWASTESLRECSASLEPAIARSGHALSSPPSLGAGSATAPRQRRVWRTPLAFLESRGDVRFCRGLHRQRLAKNTRSASWTDPWPPEAVVDRWVLEDAIFEPMTLGCALSRVIGTIPTSPSVGFDS